MAKKTSKPKAEKPNSTTTSESSDKPHPSGKPP